MTSLYESGIGVGQNPDFNEGYSADKFKYTDAEDMLSSVGNVSDLPSKKGPNLKTLSIDLNGEPIIPEGHVNVPSSIDNIDAGNGFGSNFDRNKEGANVNVVSKHMIDRKKEDSITFGEYIDVKNYLSDLPEEE
jgi:hypothetical protein